MPKQTLQATPTSDVQEEVDHSMNGPEESELKLQPAADDLNRLSSYSRRWLIVADFRGSQGGGADR